jgi:hypothetical protein
MICEKSFLPSLYLKGEPGSASRVLVLLLPEAGIMGLTFRKRYLSYQTMADDTLHHVKFFPHRRETEILTCN